jgi:dipeptidyl aminopeptidase/acylaminoacyl peptidase
MTTPSDTAGRAELSEHARRPFDTETFLRQPRLAGLALSPDGQRLVVGVSTVAPDGKRFRSALWSVDPHGQEPPRQLTRSAPGESAATFAPDGSMLFVSARPDPDTNGEGEPSPALWSLPVAGGEARLLFAPPGGLTGLAVAKDRGDVVASSSIYPGVAGLAADRDQHQAREDAGVSAQLFTDYPIRYWDDYLGPREPGRWFLAAEELTEPDAPDTGPPPADVEEEAVPEPPLLTRGPALLNADGDLTPDGRTYVTSWRRSGESRDRRRPDDLVADLVAFDVRSGERRTLVADGRWFASPVVSPDGTKVICVAEDIGAPDRVEEDGLVLVDLTDGSVRDVAPDLDLWPANPRWLPSGDAVVFEADEQGHHPLFRVDLATDEVTRLTAEGAYTDVCVAPDGGALYALHATIGSPPRPVRLDPTTADQQPSELPSPVGDTPTTGRVERVVATADDGVEVGSWLVLPNDVDGPAPLVVFIHGGPLGSWNTWHWRWNPYVLADRGYAVLLPDPALSTGYGRSFIERGWGRWGEAPYTDLMTTVEQAASHEAVDADRIAAMGGSFGGYMANWVAGNTERFRCIVTHASLWALEGFHGTTDVGLIWEREFGDPYADAARFLANSPRQHVGAIRTPMLVIHGEKDYRVPISEALILWTDLMRHGVDARFLYFPDENHWILKPQNARLWYGTVLSFLGEHLRDEPFERPELL